MIRTKRLQACWLILTGLLVVPAAFAQSLLQITSPSNLSLTAEGHVVSITVSADPSVKNVFVSAQFPLPAVQQTSDPTKFTLTLPTNVDPGWYQISAVGGAPSGLVESNTVLIDVERQDAPVSIVVEPQFFNIQGIAGRIPIPIHGVYADGTSLYLSNSTQTGVVSANTAIATVSGATTSGPGGASATSVGAGETSVVIATYPTGSTTASATATVWVTVTVPPPGPAPVITSVSPTTGTPGVTQVTFKGSNFGSAQGSGYVELGNRSATTIGLWTPTQIVATVPLGSMPGVALVKQNGLASNSFPFSTVVPSITKVTPASGTTGTAVTITGANFGATKGSSQVMFNHVAAVPTVWAAGSISAPVPVGTTTGSVVVLVNGAYSNAVDFAVPPPVIASLTPDNGAVGTAVVIKGSNFAAAQNTSTVTFNGISATPTLWAAGSITAKVPTGAITGPVIVTVNGVASNAPTFWVNSASDFAGTLTVPSIGTTGPATRVPATGNLLAGQNASLTFTGAVGQALSFNLVNSTIGSATSSCAATLYDPLNNVIGNGPCGALAGSQWMGPIASTVAGTYRLYLVPGGGATGSVSASVNNDSDVTSPAITIGGSAVTTTTVIAGQDVRLSFTAAAAQHISVTATNVTNPSATMAVVSAGSVLAGSLINNNPAGQTFFVDTQLPQAGTYQVWIKHSSAGIGSEKLQIVGVPNDFTGTLAVPAAGKTGAATKIPATGTLSAGQNAKLTFQGTAGQKLSFNVLNSTIGTSSTSCGVTIYDPNQNGVAAGNCGAGTAFINTLTLAATGTYTLYIDPQGSTTGSMSISMNNDQDVTTPAITIGGSAATAATVVAGQDVRLSFTAAANQHILVSATNVTNPSAVLYVVSPSGIVLDGTGINNNPAGQTFSLDTHLTAAGTYQLLVQHSLAAIGSETLKIVDGSADFTGTLTVPAAGTTGPTTQVPTTGNLATGQNARLTFSGIGGQRLSFNVSNSTFDYCVVIIYDPSHNALISDDCSAGASYIDTLYITSTGTYTFSIANQGSVTGSVRISVNNDQDVTTPAILIGGIAVPVTTKLVGQDARLSFTTTAPQHILLSATNVTNPYAGLYVVAPSGFVLASTTIANTPVGQTFSVDAHLAGNTTYQLWVQHLLTDIGSETLQIATVPTDFAGTLTVPAAGTIGPAIQVPTTGNLAKGEKATLTFSGTSGQKLSFNVSNSTIGTSSTSCRVTLYDGDLEENVVGSGYCGKGPNFVDTVTLPTTGIYKFYVDPLGSTGSMSVSVNNDQDVVTPAILIGGSAVTTKTTVAGQDVRLSFTTATAQHIGVTATNVTNPSAILNVSSPSVSVLASTQINNNPAGQTFFVDTQLAGGDTYQLWAQHSSTGIGSETLQISVVAADFTGTLTVPSVGTTGPATQVPTSGNLAAGQNARLTFSGTAGQKLSFNVLSSTIGISSTSCRVTVYDPFQTVVGSGYCGVGSSSVSQVTLAATGTYSFYIDPQGAATGMVAISVNNL